MSAVTKVTIGYHSPLSELGFVRVSYYRWVKDVDADVRLLFSVNPLKGAQYSPCWGFNANFIPKLNPNGALQWGRTAKTAKYDLCIDPVDVKRGGL